MHSHVTVYASKTTGFVDCEENGERYRTAGVKIHKIYSYFDIVIFDATY